MVARRIRELRLDRQYSQEHMAEQLAVSQSTYSRMEQGRSALTWPRLKRIAQVLDVPISHLVPPPGGKSAVRLARQLRTQLNKLLARYRRLEKELDS